MDSFWSYINRRHRRALVPHHRSATNVPPGILSTSLRLFQEYTATGWVGSLSRFSRFMSVMEKKKAEWGKYGTVLVGDTEERQLLEEHRLAEKKRQWSVALDLAKRLTRLDDTRFEYWQLQGFAEERLSRGIRAADCYRQGLKYAKRPHDRAGLQLALARAFNIQNAKPAALQAATDATQTSPDFIQAHTMRAILLTEMGRIKEALAARTEVIRCQPRVAQSWLSRAIHHSQCNDFALAVQDLEYAARLRPFTEEKELRTAIIIYTELDEYDRAVELINQLLAIRPNDSEALIRKAKCLEWLNRLPEALVVLTDCISFPTLKIPALQLRFELNQKSFHVTGDPRFLTQALDDSKSLANLRPVKTQHILSLQHTLSSTIKPT
jgi:tetratricopeptide (TPR) repeat protein